MTDIEKNPPLSAASPNVHSKRLLIGSYVAESICVIVATFVGSVLIAKLINTTSSSLTFGPVAFAETRLPAPTAQMLASPNPALSTFFENGSSAISRDNKALLSNVAVALRECARLKMVAVGSSSSAPYEQDHDDERNILLANQRAENVVKFLHSAEPQLNVSAKKVSSIKRRYYDVRTSAKHPRMTEALNRRVDIFFNDVDCAPAAPSDGA